MKVIEIYRRDETKNDKITRLSRQLRDAQERNSKAFDQGAAMVINALRAGATLEDIAQKIRWEYVDTQPRVRDSKVAIPLELDDSNEDTEPVIMLEDFNP